ncbi:MAG: type II secretion system protein M [Turicibacter sp.]|nr:type II secretion system protein M [Turicibacter sp.]
MQISQRDKNLLIIIGGILIAALYYQFVFSPNRAKIAELDNELSTIETRYNQVMQNIATLETRKKTITKLSTAIIEKTSDLYPTLIQEKIILELDKLISENDVEVTIGFSQVTARAVEPFTGGTYVAPRSSLSDLAEEYEGLMNPDTDNKTTVPDNTLQGLAQGNYGSMIPDTTNPTENLNGQANLTTSTATAEVMSIAITCSGLYENVKAFIDAIQNWNYNLVITNLSLSPTNVGSEVSGSFTLEFYAVPKLDGQDQEYLDWALEGTYGKEIPFSEGAATGAYSDTMEKLLAAGIKTYDFMMLVRSSTSDLPAVTVGKALDETRSSYLFTDKNEVERVKITLKQEGDKYYYRLETSEGQYPVGEQDEEFKPTSETINIQIMSESRPDLTDKVGVEVTVSNQTDLIVDVEIKEDDSTNPRVKVVSEGSVVNVTNK